MTPFLLRPYQERIVNEIGDKNTIILLPTGAGKTVCPAELVRRRKSNGNAKKCLFFVPTCILVGQQAGFIRTWTGLEVGEHFGGKTLPASFDILVSTPKAFMMKQVKYESLIGWNNFDLIVFDEVHHVLKDHPYRKIAFKLQKICPSVSPQVIGLTASMTYAVNERDIEKVVAQLTREMRIEKISTATEAELKEGGYNGNSSLPEVFKDKESFPTAALTMNTCPPDERKPHLMLKTFWKRHDSGKSTQFAKDLLRHIRDVEGVIKKQVDCAFFVSPLLSQNKMSKWGEYAFKRKKKFPENSASRLWYHELEQWYEGLRILVTSWEENQEGAVMFLRMMGCDHINKCSFPSFGEPYAIQLMNSAFDFFQSYGIESFSSKFEILKRVLLHKIDVHGGSESFRGILFVQQRVTTHILDYLIKNDDELKSVFHSSPLYAVTSPATPSLSITKSQGSEVLNRFRMGELNLLISTVVAEEGMDIPAANCVIRYDPVHNAVSHVQGRGRARQETSSFVVLSERSDRPVEMLQSVAIKQQKIAANFLPKNTMTAECIAKEHSAQKSREKNAVPGLFNAQEETSVADLNLFCTKTKTVLDIAWTKIGSGYECLLVYESCLRKLRTDGTSTGKKVAKKYAAWKMIQLLKQLDL